MGSIPMGGLLPAILRRASATAMAKDDRIIISMACGECKERNYATSKNKRNDSARLELRKFCPRCGHHTVHREAK